MTWPLLLGTGHAVSTAASSAALPRIARLESPSNFALAATHDKVISELAEHTVATLCATASTAAAIPGASARYCKILPIIP
jgi:hypothetical protein